MLCAFKDSINFKSRKTRILRTSLNLTNEIMMSREEGLNLVMVLEEWILGDRDVCREKRCIFEISRSLGSKILIV